MDFDQYYNSDNDKCLFYNETTQAWSQKGCTMEKNSLTNKRVICKCDHLTLFSFGNLDLTEKITQYGIKEFTKLTLELPGFILPVILFIAFIITMLRARFTKQSNREPPPEKINTKFRQEPKKLDFNELESKSKSIGEFRTSRRLTHKSTNSDFNNLERKKNPSDKFLNSESKFFENGENIHSEPDILYECEYNKPNQPFGQISDEERNESFIEQVKSINKSNRDLEDLGRVHDQNFLENLDKAEPVAEKNKEQEGKFRSCLKVYSDHCETIYVVFLNRSVDKKYFLITKIFFIIFIEIFLDALFFDNQYRSKSPGDFKTQLEENYSSTNLTAVLFTAACISIVKLVLYFMQVIKVKRRIKYRFLILPFIFVLVYGYILYQVSVISTGFGKFISQAWVTCSLISLTIEIILFEPVGSIVAGKIKEKFLASSIYLKISKLWCFWRFGRCKNCKKCQRCKDGIECEICKGCESCNDFDD